MKNDMETKRFNLVLPAKIVDELQEIADEWMVSKTEVVKRFLHAGFVIWEADKSPDKAIFIREGEKLERIKFL